jgi:hypothetical protein
MPSHRDPLDRPFGQPPNRTARDMGRPPERPGGKGPEGPSGPARPAGPPAPPSTPISRPGGMPPSRPPAPPPARPTGGPAQVPVSVPPPAPPRAGGTRAGLPPVNLPVLTAAFAPETAAEISSLQSSVSALQTTASLTEVQADITQLDQTLTRLVHGLEAARKAGYVYSGDIDPTLNSLMGQWQQVKPQVDNAVYQQGSALAQTVNGLQGPLAQLQANPAQAQARLPQVSAAVSSALSSARQVESNLKAMYAAIETGVSDLNSRLGLIEQILKWFGSVTFKLGPGESPVQAVPAEFGSEKDPPNGFLFLTDKRLLFEQNEEIAKKKVLFIATEKELVHRLLLEALLDSVGAVTASKKGFLGHEDHLDVAFSGKSAHFHINGQDSKTWQAQIEKARSGGLASERAAAGAGVSLADMTGPISEADIIALQSRVNDLQSRALLGSAKDAVEDLGNKAAALPAQLHGARAQGYVFEKALEGQATGLVEQWTKVKAGIDTEVQRQSDALTRTVQALQQQMLPVMGGSKAPESVRPAYLQVKSLAASADAQAAAAEQAIFKQYDSFQASVEALGAHLEWLNWLLAALATASFRLLETEGGVAATQANWLRPNDGPQGGVLFITDQRLIFEEREGEFSVPLEVPLTQVQSVEALAGQGANKDEQHLKVSLGAGAPAPAAEFQLVGPSAESWKITLSRAMKGDYAGDRAVAVDPAAVDKVKNAPTQCPNCGGAFTKPVLRGQAEIKCGFCGAVTRL